MMLQWAQLIAIMPTARGYMVIWKSFCALFVDFLPGCAHVQITEKTDYNLWSPQTLKQAPQKSQWRK